MSELHLPHDHGHHSEKLIPALPESEDFIQLSDLFRQLGDSTRIRIFWILCHCEECVINLSAMTKMSSPAVSHHLKQLKSAGLIVSRRDGKEVYYRASDTLQVKLLHDVIKALAANKCPDEENCITHK